MTHQLVFKDVFECQILSLNAGSLESANSVEDSVLHSVSSCTPVEVRDPLLCAFIMPVACQRAVEMHWHATGMLRHCFGTVNQ